VAIKIPVSSYNMPKAWPNKIADSGATGAGGMENEISVFLLAVHPHIAQFFGVYRIKGGIGIVTELCAKSLSAEMEELRQKGEHFGSRCTRIQMLQLMRQIADGLTHLHTKLRIIHGECGLFVALLRLPWLLPISVTFQNEIPLPLSIPLTLPSLLLSVFCSTRMGRQNCAILVCLLASKTTTVDWLDKALRALCPLSR